MRNREQMVIKIVELLLTHGFLPGGYSLCWLCDVELVAEQMAEAMDGKKRTSFPAPCARRHDERAAVARLREACEKLEVGEGDLAALRQNDPVKQAVAWWVKRGTVVGTKGPATGCRWAAG